MQAETQKGNRLPGIASIKLNLALRDTLEDHMPSS